MATSQRVRKSIVLSLVALSAVFLSVAVGTMTSEAVRQAFPLEKNPKEMRFSREKAEEGFEFSERQTYILRVIPRGFGPLRLFWADLKDLSEPDGELERTPQRVV